MKKINLCTCATLACALFASCLSTEGDYYPDITTTHSPKGTAVFAPDSLSIAQHYTIPQWFTNSKLGIFIHWGVYTVPAYGSEWYARHMYDTSTRINKYHVETYGALDQFGYKDFIPMFHASNFDAAQWARLFKASGAKYVVPVAEHHDGFAMYNSTYNKWNSVNMGPEIDVIGELSKAVREEGMRFGVSSHRAENAWFYNKGLEVASDVQNRDISLYGERIERPEGKGMVAYCGKYPGSNEKSRAEWLNHVYELVDQYQPDLVWFDWTVGKYPFQPTFYKFMAYYYNNAIDWNKEVVINTKVGYGNESQVFDIERGKSDIIRKYAWQTDTSIGKKSWSYTPDEENKTPNHIIDDFVDIVSKNGNLLLNIGPRVDGTITEEQQHVLRELGSWLAVNGSAIYDTHPWVRSGEGANKGTAGFMTDGEATTYEANDIRFTQQGDTLYAIALEETTDEILLTALAKGCGRDIKVQEVSLLGSSAPIEWQQSDKGVEIHFPSTLPTRYAHAFKIRYTGIVYGDIQAEVVNNSLVATQYIRNNTAQAAKVVVSCQRNSDTPTLQTVQLPPHQTVGVEFTYPAPTPNQPTQLTLRVDGEVIAEQSY